MRPLQRFLRTRSRPVRPTSELATVSGPPLGPAGASIGSGSRAGGGVAAMNLARCSTHRPSEPSIALATDAGGRSWSRHRRGTTARPRPDPAAEGLLASAAIGPASRRDRRRPGAGLVYRAASRDHRGQDAGLRHRRGRWSAWTACMPSAGTRRPMPSGSRSSPTPSAASSTWPSSSRPAPGGPLRAGRRDAHRTARDLARLGSSAGRVVLGPALESPRVRSAIPAGSRPRPRPANDPRGRVPHRTGPRGAGSRPPRGSLAARARATSAAARPRTSGIPGWRRRHGHEPNG